MKLVHIGDVLAIPFFLLLTYYFHTMENKTPLEWVLYLFSITGAVIDSIFTYYYVNGTTI